MYIQFFGDLPRSGSYPAKWYDNSTFEIAANFLNKFWPCDYFIFSHGHHKLSWKKSHWRRFRIGILDTLQRHGCTPILQTATPVRQWRNTKFGRKYAHDVLKLPVSKQSGYLGLERKNRSLKTFNNKVFAWLGKGWMLLDAYAEVMLMVKWKKKIDLIFRDSLHFSPMVNERLGVMLSSIL